MGAPKTFEDVLEKIRTESKNSVELGTKFENLMISFFRSDSMYKREFDKVWRFGDWAREYGIEKSNTKKKTKDDGIDIIAQIRSESKKKEFCAIQCKAYADDRRISKPDIETFLSEIKNHNDSKHNITREILATTSEDIGDTAYEYINKPHSRKIDKDTLRASSIDWSKYPKILPKKPKSLYDYQKIAFEDVKKGFGQSERGKLIMACGTGKTLVSLHVAERIAGRGKLILYLVPSISLILQSMREWSDNANIAHYYMAVCSDKSVKNSEDGTMVELESPASTSPEMLKERLKNAGSNTMNVIFCTYNSIDVVSKATNGRKFDLVFSDEAHRTTSISDKKLEPFYSKVHHDKNISARKRLYMTATPRIYTGNVKGRAQAEEKEVISMDDVEVYGPEFHNLKFRDAVHKYGALCDFKIHVTVMDSNLMDRIVQKSQAGDEYALPVSEQTLLASVWHAIQYPEEGNHPKLLQRVIAFCDMINSSKLFAGVPLKHKLDILEKPKEDQEKIRESDKYRSFKNLVSHVNTITGMSDNDVDVKHIDGSDNAQTRRRELEWLKSSNDNPNECRIISNARCLSEGVDVPALDAVVFMNPRKSVVDVVQAVGRVMRKADGKKYGYIILPVALPMGMSEDEALSNNKHFKTVWQVISALKSHDADLGEEINQLTLAKIQNYDTQITPRIIIKHAYGHDYHDYRPIEQKIINGVATRLIKRIGDTYYYDRYGQKLGSATRTIEERLKNKMNLDNLTKKEIQKFHKGLQNIINESVTETATIQAISQHMVLSRVFDVLFSGKFTSQNPISIAFNTVIDKIGFKEELKDLEEFYIDVERNAAQIKTKEARQNFIKKIYANFFESADKKGTEKHGIVYTPIEIIDFIINSTQYILKTQFDTDFNDRSVKVLEPFAGTGTFLVRLLESGYITNNLYQKYKNDIFANEIILLAYYIASVNIETAYANLKNSGKYVPFEGLSYTDTLRINSRYRNDERHRKEPMVLDQFKMAHDRLRNQKGTHLHVIIGNPPYSVGQKDAADDNPNIKYPELDERIKNTYKTRTKTIRVTPLYDSYIRSIRWASDRIGRSGVISIITNASFIRTPATAGVRACLAEEFTDVYCFDLRGDQNNHGEISKKEGGKIFGGGSKSPIAIVILVKNPKKKTHSIHYKDIGDYTSRDEKLDMVKNFKSILKINWDIITPDKHHDWLDQQNDDLLKYTSMGSESAKSGKSKKNKKNNVPTYSNMEPIFEKYSLGTSTNRDVWVYNSSKTDLEKNMRKHVNYCNAQDPKNPRINPMMGKLTRGLRSKLKNKRPFDEKKIRISLYRPFFKQYLYFDSTRTYNEDVHLMPKFFPENRSKNLAICVPDKGKIGIFSVLITEVTPDLHVIEQSQCFPLYIYKNHKDKKSNIIDSVLQEYQQHYDDKKITKKDIFYYVYGLLHHTDYKKKFANNLSKKFPHIPMAPNFWKFAETGEKLVDLHLNFETCEKYDLGKPKNRFDNLEKMAFSRVRIDGKSCNDVTKLKINGIEVFDNIPNIQYQVNGRTPLGWIIDQYETKFDKKGKSGIVKKHCEGMTEKKTIALIERMVYIGVKSDKIIEELSKEEFEPDDDWKPKMLGMDSFVKGGSAQSTL